MILDHHDRALDGITGLCQVVHRSGGAGRLRGRNSAAASDGRRNRHDEGSLDVEERQIETAQSALWLEVPGTWTRVTRRFAEIRRAFRLRGFPTPVGLLTPRSAEYFRGRRYHLP